MNLSASDEIDLAPDLPGSPGYIRFVRRDVET